MVERVLPPGVDANTLDTFFDLAQAEVGAGNVSRDPSSGAPHDLHGKNTNYGDPFPLARDHPPSAAVRPETVQQIQRILKLANTYNVPLWTVSRGKNLGYGASSPVVPGSVILDLHRMNKIIEINEEYAYAVVEPGVTFFDLYNAIQQRGLRLWPSCPSLGWGSIVGNALERGFGYTPEGEHSQSLCGMEVVLPNGEVVRTGMGAMEGNKMFAMYKGGFGPSIDGLFFQSNLGVVTKIGIHITPAPEAYARCVIGVKKEEDLVPLVGKLSNLLRRRIIANYPGLTDLWGTICTLMQDEDVRRQVEPYLGKTIPASVLEKIQQQRNLPFWTALFSLYGTPEIVQSQLQTIKRDFETLADAEITTNLHTASPGQTLPASVIGPELEILPQTGRPTLASMQMLDSIEPGCGHIAFAPVLPTSGRELYAWYREAKCLTETAGFNFLADFHLFPRFMIPINLVVFTGDRRRKMDELLRKLTTRTAEMGYAEYRTHVSYMDEVAGHYSFNDGALRRVTTGLKDFLDPRGVLAPGKSGIWNSKGKRRDVSPHI